MRYLRTFLQVSLLLLTTLSVSAQTPNQSTNVPDTQDLNSVVSGSKTTYLELVRKVLTDVQLVHDQVYMAIAHNTVPFKHLSEETKPATLQGDLKLQSFEPSWIRSDGRRILLLKLDILADEANQGTNYQGEATILAAFSLQPTPKLLDVLDIKTDRFTGYWEKPSVFQLSSRNDAFLVYSSHWNAGENYSDLTVLFLNNDRFNTITNIFLFDTQGCGATFTETPSFRVLPGTTQKYPKLMVNVMVKKDPDSPECDRRTRGYIKSYQAVYRWNAAKSEYETASRQLEALDKFNQDRL